MVLGMIVLVLTGEDSSEGEGEGSLPAAGCDGSGHRVLAAGLRLKASGGISATFSRPAGLNTSRQSISKQNAKVFFPSESDVLAAKQASEHHMTS
jgi:hypothetical protein